jgi:ribosomal protein S18 acetylase RimI-like enzyme
MIRKAVENDENGVRGCAEDAYKRYVAAIGQKPAPMLADFKSQIAEGCVHVATNDLGDIEGFIVFFQRDEHMFLESVAVLSAAAGRGIGKQLIQFCESETVRLGLRSIQLYTNEKMAENLAIYPHLGYLETGRRTENGFNRVYFEKHLS